MRHPAIRAGVDYPQHRATEKLQVTVAHIVRQLDEAHEGAGTAQVIGHGLGRDRRQALEQAEADREMNRDELIWTDDAAPTH